ncbi:MAG: hypothetical protein ACI90V_005333 [Bacillariaceae sp.]|jgi:hypothetical protein
MIPEQSKRNSNALLLFRERKERNTVTFSEASEKKEHIRTGIGKKIFSCYIMLWDFDFSNIVTLLFSIVGTVIGPTLI